MRVLVIGEEPARRAVLGAAVERAGHEVCAAAASPHSTALVRLTDPQAVLVETAELGTLRRLLERVRPAARQVLPAIAVVPESSVWLRTALPPDLAPLAVLAGGSGLSAALASTLQGYRRQDGEGEPPPVVFHGGSLGFTPATRRLAGPQGEAVLTASEATMLVELASREPDVVPAERLALALWGETSMDRHGRAAIRAHIYTLRRKLAATGLDDCLVTLRGVGYRLVLPAP